MKAATSKTLAKIQIMHTDEEVTAWSRDIELIGPDGLNYKLNLSYTLWDGFELNWADGNQPDWADDLDPSHLDLLTNTPNGAN